MGGCVALRHLGHLIGLPAPYPNWPASAQHQASFRAPARSCSHANSATSTQSPGPNAIARQGPGAPLRRRRSRMNSWARDGRSIKPERGGLGCGVCRRSGWGSLWLRTLTLKGCGTLWENLCGGSLLAAADLLASGVMDADAPQELLRPGPKLARWMRSQLMPFSVAQVYGFRRSSTQPVLSLQHRRQWGWPVSSNSST